jgi:hypothetical protein
VNSFCVAVVSDLHYAGKAERARSNYCLGVIGNPVRRLAVRCYRHFYWMRDSFAHNHLLAEFIRRASGADLIVANGDYSCDTAFVGLSDDASFGSAIECFEQLRSAFGQRLLATIGDHELGKMPLGAEIGGLRLPSFQRSTEALGIEPFWQRQVGRHVLLGITATLVALPVHENEALPAELPRWRELRRVHLDAIRAAFSQLEREQQVILFCHDPSALPFLWEEEAVRAKLAQVECTVIGHLHSPFVYWQSRVLCGMPAISGFGHTVKRLSSALRQARYWKPFNVVLCPALAGIELLKDGGYLMLELSEDARVPVKVNRFRIPR